MRETAKAKKERLAAEKIAEDSASVVAGQHAAATWTFTVMKKEWIQTPLGNVHAVHLLKSAPSDAKNQQLDVWLAPSLEWYPVRFRYTDPNDDFVEQTVISVSKTPS